VTSAMAVNVKRLGCCLMVATLLWVADLVVTVAAVDFGGCAICFLSFSTSSRSAATSFAEAYSGAAVGVNGLEGGVGGTGVSGDFFVSCAGGDGTAGGTMTGGVGVTAIVFWGSCLYDRGQNATPMIATSTTIVPTITRFQSLSLPVSRLGGIEKLPSGGSVT